ncbi:MAG: hypothetical protein R2729_32260 [Bryobacteraceae bacterium]
MPDAARLFASSVLPENRRVRLPGFAVTGSLQLEGMRVGKW